jgi:tryptophanyl-tRNA synthetase
MTTSTTPANPTIFSGIKPTGEKTLGNYAGGFSQYVRYQEEGQAFFAVVDLHSVTVAYDPRTLAAQTLDLAALLFATGLDPARATVFVQSHVKGHAEGARLLASVTAYGDLKRMHQFKEKGEEQDFVSLALFDYPTLMAADILLYGTDLVPIGDDQRQHLELARDIATRFNSRFGATFTVPEGRYPEVGARVMDLQDPTRKMGTTSAEGGTIRLLDPPDVISKKIKAAVTDSGREVRYAPDKPGIANLLEILAVVTGTSIPELEASYADVGYGPFKVAVADAVVTLLEPVQARYHELRGDEAELRRLLATGAEKAAAASTGRLTTAYERMGFLAP